MSKVITDHNWRAECIVPRRKGPYMNSVLMLAFLFGLSGILAVSATVLLSDNFDTSTTLYVSPSGDNANSGVSWLLPLQTLEEAKTRVRSLNAFMASDIVVLLAGGRYEQSVPLVFSEQDSGANGYNVIWKNKDGECPVISGGVLKNMSFSPWKDSIYLSNESFIFPYRDLWINGERCSLARLENTNPVRSGAYFVDTDNLYIRFDPQYEHHIQVPKSEWVDIDFSKPELPEIQVLDKWMSHIVHVSGVKTNGDYVYLELAEPDRSNMADRNPLSVKDAFITLDLGSVKTINQTQIAWFYGASRDSYYDLLVSTNGSVWSFVKSNVVRTVRSNSLLDINSGTYQARYVRYVLKGTSINPWDYISEIQLFSDGIPVSVGSSTFTRGTYVNASAGAVTDGSLNTYWKADVPDFNAFKGSFWLQNHRAYLDQGGEFIRAAWNGGAFLYVPREGETPSSLPVVAGRIPTIVAIKGGSAPVRNLVFEGIHFADTTYSDIDNNGFVDMQAGTFYTGNNETATVPAAIDVDNAEAVEFYRCSFYRLGGAAINFSKKVCRSVIEGCAFVDIGDGAVSIYSEGRRPMFYTNIGNSCDLNKISMNYFRDIGRQMYGAVAIWGVGGRSNTVSHNSISNVNYSAVSWGWGWGLDDDAPVEDNRIEYNRIERALAMLSDGGGIYTTGNQMDVSAGSCLFENYINGFQRYAYANSNYTVAGIYFDKGSQNILAENNVIANVPTEMYENVYGLLTDNGIVYDRTSYDAGVVARSGLVGTYTNIPDTYALARPAQQEKRNVSLGSILYSSSENSEATRAERAVDLDINTIWASGSGDSSPCYTVDLLKTYPLSRIEIIGRQNEDQPDSRKNFVVEASNDNVSWSVIALQDATPYAFQTTWCADIMPVSRWRYVRVRKTDGQHFNFSEFKILMSDY
ncbi:discoidin domain-containing protein [Pontiella sulfatireligans]|uniref:F5/8 type C domain-containing protein n=1 Tax=Pontiella sulfatireligans TaxID=2750658 RepID=A0A6C2UMW8_9BACT|nr:discoidin domain-containing protein [Pontiella sulfatireligans]VGO20654.1 hypothetical protein SCARR_02720 [Pontiella sulfatireligans]